MLRESRHFFSILCLLIALSLTAAACVDPDADADATSDASESDADMMGGDDGAGEDMTLAPVYRFVRIQSGPGTEVTGEDPGADIDAVLIERENNLILPTNIRLDSDMSQYENYKTRDIDAAGLTINAFSETDPSMITADSTCETSSDGFVSIGGENDLGAIWTFAEGFEENDTLYVIEVGGCMRANGGMTPGSEAYSVSVSVADLADGTWVPLGTRVNDSPVSAISIPAL